MSVDSILQAVSTISNTLAVLVLAVGYYIMTKLCRKWFRESKEARTVGGRPMAVGTVFTRRHDDESKASPY